MSQLRRSCLMTLGYSKLTRKTNQEVVISSVLYNSLEGDRGFSLLPPGPLLVTMCLWQKGVPWCVMVEPVPSKTLKVYASHIAQGGFILAIRTVKIYRLCLPSFTSALAGRVIQRPPYILFNRFSAMITGLDCVTCSHILE